MDMEEPRTIRFDLDLSKKDYSRLNGILKTTNRSRKNFCESLAKLAIRKFGQGNQPISMMDLGIVEPTEKEVEP